MILVNRHTDSGGPFHATLRIQPASRVDLIDVRGRLREEFGPDFTQYPQAFYISDHTTAGYLDRRIAEVLEHDGENIQDYLQVFQKLFPPDAGYTHDELHLRTELSDQQRATEPRNADSHLTFMGGGLRNCASYEQRGDEPVWFVELDGVHAGGGAVVVGGRRRRARGAPPPPPHQRHRLSRGAGGAATAGLARCVAPPDRRPEPA